MSIDFRVFDVNITCAEGIKGILSFTNFFLKSKVYAAVSVVGISPAAQETPLAKYFGENPVWNFPMRFYLEESKLQENALTLKIQLRRKRTLGGGDEDIAEVLIPLRNLFNGNENVTDENYSSSFLLSKSGGRRGLVYFSYRFSRTYPASAAGDDGSVVAPPSALERRPLPHRRSFGFFKFFSNLFSPKWYKNKKKKTHKMGNHYYQLVIEDEDTNDSKEWGPYHNDLTRTVESKSRNLLETETNARTTSSRPSFPFIKCSKKISKQATNSLEKRVDYIEELEEAKGY